jgi:hypothetical protein
VIGSVCTIYDDPAPSPSDVENVLDVIELAQLWLCAGGVLARLHQEQNREAAGRHFLPAAKKVPICVFRKRSAPEKRRNRLQSIECSAERSYGTAPKNQISFQSDRSQSIINVSKIAKTLVLQGQST